MVKSLSFFRRRVILANMNDNRVIKEGKEMTEQPQNTEKQTTEKTEVAAVAKKPFFTKRDLLTLLIMTLAAFLSAFNTKTFIYAGELAPGGLTGITIFIQTLASTFFHVSLPFAPINLLLNAFPIYLAVRFLGKKFTLFSVYVVVLVSFLVDIIPAYAITYDILLISVFGGIIAGIAGSMCLWRDATGGGTDFIAMYLSVTKGIDAFNIIFGCNVMILLLYGVLFGWDKALYSIIYQYVYTQVVHHLFRKYQQETLFIITDKADEVAKAIHDITHHGATILNGTGAYKRKQTDILYSIVSRGEVRKVMSVIQEIDPHAFVNAIRTEELKGRFYQKPME